MLVDHVKMVKYAFQIAVVVQLQMSLFVWVRIVTWLPLKLETVRAVTLYPN